jgi:hypothetical protein
VAGPTPKKTGKKGKKARLEEERRRRRNWILGALGAAVVLVLAVGLGGLAIRGDASANGPTQLETGAWLKTLSIRSNPGTAATLPELLPTAKRITKAPSLLYIGGEFCPYCAASRWALVIALSRFGTFSHLDTMRSSTTDVYPDTATWTFYHDAYHSPYLSVETIEAYSRKGPQYPLEKIPEPYLGMWEKLDVPPQTPAGDYGAIPFILVGGKYLWVKTLYNPEDLAGVSWSDIIAAVKKNQAPMGPAINANANMLTAAFCNVDGYQPSTVCSTAAILKDEGTLNSLKPGP